MHILWINVDNFSSPPTHSAFDFFHILYYTNYMANEFTKYLEKIETALNYAINMDFDDDWKKYSFGESAAKKNYIQNLIEPNKNLIDLGGKRWRPLLLLLCYEMEKNHNKEYLTEEQTYALTPLVEFVHTASLIHDDIEDSADLRRGKPAAHITYGLDTALNAASWLYFEAPVCIDRLNLSDALKVKFYKLYTTELRRLHLGQAMDIFWHREKSFFPEIPDYMEMVKCKTGTLASLAAKVGTLAGGASEEKTQEIGAICANIGIGFQIIDDVINLTCGNPGKKRGDDIVEGKKSLPVLMHIQSCPQDKAELSKLMEQAAKEGIESPAVEQCIGLLEKSGCIKQAADKGIQLIRENCEKLSESPLIFKLFDAMIPEAFK